MRVMFVGTMMAMAVVAGPAFGPEEAPSSAASMERSGLMQDLGSRPGCRDSGGEFGRGLASVGLSLIYTPFRLVYGLVGAELGGIAGWTTGGDRRASRALWRPTLDGDYYIRAGHLDGTEPFRFSDATRPESARYGLGAPFSATLEHDAPSDDADLLEPP